jgi:DNA-binding transcriptional ArsR family regulator
MSHHFQKLVTSDVIRERKEGTEKYYSLNIELLAAIGIDVTKL